MAASVSACVSSLFGELALQQLLQILRHPRRHPVCLHPKRGLRPVARHSKGVGLPVCVPAQSSCQVAICHASDKSNSSRLLLPFYHSPQRTDESNSASIGHKLQAESNGQ